jgi:polysaccharide export outer membrane protein
VVGSPAKLAASHSLQKPTIPAFDENLVKAGDSLRIKVRGREELTRIITVNEHGILRFPLVDRLPVEGKTIKTVEQQLSQALEKYIKAPEIEISRVYRVKIFGQVVRQGVFQFDQAPTIPEVLARAEGITRSPSDENGAPRIFGHLMARIVRSGNPTKVYDLGAYLKTGQGLEDVVLRDSVTLLIEYNDYLPITLLGTVRTTVLYKPGLKLLEAIALAGGLLDEEKQNIKNIRILRHLEDGKVQRLEVNLHDLIHRGQVNRDIEVLPGDYIVVPRRSKRRTVWNIVNTVLKPFVQVGLLGFYF